MGAGYAYIMTHPGMPCVFWEHYFDWGADMKATIDKLMQASAAPGARAPLLYLGAAIRVGTAARPAF